MQSSNHHQPAGGLSITRTLARLTAIPANRICADCKSTLVDASQVHASFHPPAPTTPTIPSSSSRFTNFRLNHSRFAPPGHERPSIENDSTPSPPPPPLYDPPMDPALFAGARVGGHGVFCCAPCAAAHKLLGKSITIVQAVQDYTLWSNEQVQLLAAPYGGNARSWLVLEAHVPVAWQMKRPRTESSVADRLMFVRAKYQALLFCLPPSGPLAPRAWRRIVERHEEEWKGLWGTNNVANLAQLEVQNSMRGASFRALATNNDHDNESPSRLVDYFCIITASDYLDTSLRGRDLSQLEAVENMLLAPVVSDCFPAQDGYDDMEFPEHVGTFVCPEGIRPRRTPVPPTFFTFVLTCSDGNRLYGGVLQAYDMDQDMEFLSQVLDNSGYEGRRPPWMPLSSDSNSLHSKSSSLRSRASSARSNSDVIYLPKSLVILSHYPFFDLWRKFLLQIYRIALVEAPLPIERFIANFVCEVPLPPPGKIQVKFGFTVKDIWLIQRPAENQLPMANFSLQPLFASLSITNVLVVIGCLLQETRVALCSEHYALLTPAAEALVTLLFPFHWQGMYVPIMPYSMLDILEAPVPFIVGLHARYLTETPIRRRPQGVVFVDLDKDTVHLGFDDDSTVPRRTPSLPERAAMKLRSRLETYASSVYAIPYTNKVGSITSGKQQQLPYGQRDSYAHLTSAEISGSHRHRKEIFSNIDKAYDENELLKPITSFLCEQGQLYEKAVGTPNTDPVKGKAVTRFKFLRRHLGQGRSVDSLDSDNVSVGGQSASRRTERVLEMEEPEDFSVDEIRNAFLRFFVSIFRDFRLFIDGDKFRSIDFVSSLNLHSSSETFMNHLLDTQLFNRFLSERKENAKDPEVLFFDESVNAKVNRSKKTALTNIGRGVGKKVTSFIDDTSKAVTDTYTPPPPSNWGLPDDGRSYQYGQFPALEAELFGKTRAPMMWPTRQRRSSLRTARRASAFAQANEQAMVAKALQPASIAHLTKRGVRNLESALGALSSPFVAPILGRRKLEKKGTPESLFRRMQSKHTAAESDISAVTLPSTLDMDSEIMSTAEEVVLNARRKQAILIGIMIQLQSICRMHLSRRWMGDPEFLNMIQLPHNGPVEVLIDTRVSAEAEAATLIQTWSRERRQRLDFILARRRLIQLQSLIRSRRVRFVYKLVQSSIAKVQAQARLFLVDQRLERIFHDRMELYRRHIFQLWQRACTPLSYRSKFWPLVNIRQRCLRIGIAESEIHRLWSELGIDQPSLPYIRQAEGSEALSLALKMGMSIRLHWTCVKIDANFLSDGVMGMGSAPVGKAAQRIAAERTQMYDRISDRSRFSPGRLHVVMKDFDVPVKGSRKKVALVETVWGHISQADASAALMLELFPELGSSTNICFSVPSKKGIRRFRSSDAIPDQIDLLASAHALFDDRVNRNVAEVARLCLGKIQELKRRLGIMEQRRTVLFDRRRQAIMQARRSYNWENCCLQLMREYLRMSAPTRESSILRDGGTRQSVASSMTDDSSTSSDSSNGMDRVTPIQFPDDVWESQ